MNPEERQIPIQIYSFNNIEQHMSITYWFVKSVLSLVGGTNLKTESGVNA